MKHIAYSFILSLAMMMQACGQTLAFSQEVKPNFQKLVEAIGKAENSIKYPYGIKSINTHGNKTYARQICLNTVRNNYKRWIIAGQPKPFIEFLGDRYCPKVSDPMGHAVWARNVKSIYGNS